MFCLVLDYTLSTMYLTRVNHIFKGHILYEAAHMAESQCNELNIPLPIVQHEKMYEVNLEK